MIKFWSFEHLNFEFVSDFVLRISNFPVNHPTVSPPNRLTIQPFHQATVKPLKLYLPFPSLDANIVLNLPITKNMENTQMAKKLPLTKS